MSAATEMGVDDPTRSLTGHRLAWLGSLVVFAGLPAIVIGLVFTSAAQDDVIAIDFRQFYAAAQVILHGDNPYANTALPLTAWGGPYPYPPLPALVTAPLTVVSVDLAGIFLMTVLVFVALSIPYLLGVRDWRCFGIALMWPPVISAIQTGNLTLWLGLAAALTWRYRDRLLPVSASVGVSLAAKFFFWPLLVWLAATRRMVTAVASFVFGAGLLVVSWAVIGFAGFTDYPHLLNRLENTVGEDSYTVYISGLDLGLPSPVARAVWLTLGLSLLAWLVVLGRRGDERTAFVVAIAASLALTPIVWLHYFALLLVVVALTTPRLGPAWFVPLLMIITPGSGHPTPFQTAWTLAVAAVTLGLVVRTSRAGYRATLDELALQPRPLARAA